MLLGVDDFATEQTYHRGEDAPAQRLAPPCRQSSGASTSTPSRTSASSASARGSRSIRRDASSISTSAAAWTSAPGTTRTRQCERDDERRTAPSSSTAGSSSSSALARRGPCRRSPGRARAQRSTPRTRGRRDGLDPLRPGARGASRRRTRGCGCCLGSTTGRRRTSRRRTRRTSSPPAPTCSRRPSDAQPDALLGYFREFADRDTVAMKPATSPDGSAQSVYPGTDDDGVVLANVTGITLVGSTGNWKLAGYTIDRTPRRAHVATQTIEELLCGALLEGSTGGGARARSTPEARACRRSRSTAPGRRSRSRSRGALSVDREPQRVPRVPARARRMAADQGDKRDGLPPTA